ncbi:MAG: Methyltransferase type 11 [Acidobacteriales bacterium]|nr:Methyltransferase type 11 [Terriglobales bacterium]
MTEPNSDPNQFLELKKKLKATWMAGDFGQIAKRNAETAEAFIARLHLKPGTNVLDVACGTGNLAIPAARAGANVIGVDIASNLIEQARERAVEEGLSDKTQFDEGDAEQLSYRDAQFDVVVSMYGAMFAPRPDRAAAEMLRVTKPGGLIAMANWTPEGFVGQMFAITAKHAPPPPGIPPPALWGKEDVVRQRLGSGASKIETRRVMADFSFPLPPREVVEFFRKYFGPTQMTYARLDPEAQQRLTDDLVAHWTEHNKGTATSTRLDAEFLEVYATRD